MAKEICKLNLTITDNDGDCHAEGNLSFDGDGSDVVDTFVFLFEMFELEGDAALVCSLALAQYADRKKEDEHGAE